MTRRDFLIALLVAGCALALYQATLLPGMGGPEDTPKFQFLGYALGTAHPPGYPLYVLLTHAFVQLPIRTIAYRANLFSAVMAALACGVSYLIGRQIGAGRWAAACSALALATGIGFWKSAVYAEVYGLAAAIGAVTIALLLWWGACHGAKRLLAAVATFALGLGNHLTIVGLLPAGIWYILIRHRKALTLRLIAACIAVLFLGVSQYWFIVIRSRHPTTYLESQATSLTELIGVVTAQRFANERFSFGPKALLTIKVPAVASVVHQEMQTMGILLLAAGFVAAIWRKNEPAILVIATAGGLLGMVINLAGDTQGFITPVVVFLWPVAALGIQTIVDLLPNRMMARSIALVAAAALPLSGVARNYKASDRSHDTEDAQFFHAIFTQLPPVSEVVMENYWSAMMIDYLTFTGETGREGGIWQMDSRVASVRARQENGRHVFAFAESATFLGAQGLRAQRVALEGPSLNEWLKGLPRSTRVVGAVAYEHVPLESLPIDRAHAPALGTFPFGAFSWVAGETGAAVEVNSVKATLERGNIVASADQNRARIEFDGHTIVEVDEGLALAAFTPDGQLLRTLEFHPGDPLRVSLQGALYEFNGDSPCADVTTDDWSDITAIANFGSWVTVLETPGSVTIETELSGSPEVGTRASILLGNGTAQNVSQTQSSKGRTFLTELHPLNSRRSLFRLSLDRLPGEARARVKPGGSVTSVKLCAAEPTPLLSQSKNWGVLRSDFESEPYFGPGWSGSQRTNAGTMRLATDGVATLLLPLDSEDYRMGLNVEGERGTRLSLAANGTGVGTCALGTDETCEVELPRAVLRNGVNWITLATAKTFTFRGARLQRKTASP